MHESALAHIRSATKSWFQTKVLRADVTVYMNNVFREQQHPSAPKSVNK